jgi:hypothetical protein
MNADGSHGVQADISAAAKLPYLTEIGWTAIGTGVLLLLTAAGLVVFAVRGPRMSPAARPAHSTGLSSAVRDVTEGSSLGAGPSC